jgi:hypothetical protein
MCFHWLQNSILLSGKILSRMYPNSCMETDSDDEYFVDGETINQDNSVKEAMEKSTHRFLEEPEEIISNPNFQYLRQPIKEQRI